MTQDGDVKGGRPHEYVVLTPDVLQQRSSDDEISLFDLWAILARKRNLILGVLAVAIATSVAIAFMMPPVYQASIYFRVPSNSDVESLNIPDFSSDYTAEDVFSEFQDNFIARNNLWRFFTDKQLFTAYTDEKNPDAPHLRKIFESSFLRDMVMHKANKNETNKKFIHATLDWNNTAEAAMLLNEYSELILQLTNQQYIDELEHKQELEKKRIQQDIDLLRASEERLAKSRLAELVENIAIAKELGFKRSKSLEEQVASEVSVNVLEDQPLYYQGYEVLEAEKRALLARESHDPFIHGLEKLLSRLEYLNAIKVLGNNIQSAQVIQKADVSDRPIKPKKKQIVALGFVLGLMLGVFAAFISNFREKAREHAPSS